MFVLVCVSAETSDVFGLKLGVSVGVGVSVVFDASVFDGMVSKLVLVSFETFVIPFVPCIP